MSLYKTSDLDFDVSLLGKTQMLITAFSGHLLK